MIGVLLGFEIQQTVVTCDIKEMPGSFHANREHRDFLRFPLSREAYSGTLSRREIVRVNARLGEIRRDKEKLSSPISCELKRVKAS